MAAWSQGLMWPQYEHSNAHRTRRNTRWDWYSTSQVGYGSALLCNWHSQGHLLTPRWWISLFKLIHISLPVKRWQHDFKVSFFWENARLHILFFQHSAQVRQPLHLFVSPWCRHEGYFIICRQCPVWYDHSCVDFLHCIWTMCSLCRWEKRSIRCLEFFLLKRFHLFCS